MGVVLGSVKEHTSYLQMTIRWRRKCSSTSVRSTWHILRVPYSEAPSISMIPTLGPKVYKYDLLWAI